MKLKIKNNFLYFSVFERIACLAHLSGHKLFLLLCVLLKKYWWVVFQCFYIINSLSKYLYAYFKFSMLFLTNNSLHLKVVDSQDHSFLSQSFEPTVLEPGNFFKTAAICASHWFRSEFVRKICKTWNFMDIFS